MVIMHEGNTFGYEPDPSLARDDFVLNLSFGDTFSLINSDPNLQAVATSPTVLNRTPPATHSSHLENDLAYLSPSPTSVKSNENGMLLNDILKINDLPCLTYINDQKDGNPELFSNVSLLQPPATINTGEPVEFPRNTNFLNPSINYEEYHGDPLNNHNTSTMSIKDIDEFLLDPNSHTDNISNNNFYRNNNSKPNSKSSDVTNIKRAIVYDTAAPSTSFSCESQRPELSSKKALSKNALSARVNRAKKKTYVKDLEKKYEVLQKKNRDLEQKLDSVTTENEMRGSEIAYLRQVLLDETKIYKFLKEVPFIRSVGLPERLTEKGPCLRADSLADIETRCASPSCHGNDSIISEPSLVSSSSSSLFSTTSPQVMMPANGYCPVSSNSDNNNQREPFILRVDDRHEPEIDSDREDRKCFSTWGAKGKRK